MDCQQKLFEVNITIAVSVKVLEDIITEFFGVRRQETAPVHVHESLGREATIRTVLLKPSVPGHDGVNTVVGVL